MEKIIIYPDSCGFYVLASWPWPAATIDAAWRPGHEIADAKRFANEVAARTYIAKHMPDLPLNLVLIQDAVDES